MVTDDSDSWDFHDYLRLPHFSVSKGRALVRKLEIAMPEGLPAVAKSAAEGMIAARRVLDASYEGFDPPTIDGDRRPLATRVDRSWSAMHARLSAYAMLPDELELAPRAELMMRKLFPEGLTFLRLAYQEEWIEADDRLEMVVKQDLEGELATLVGPDFLRAVRRAHTAYGDALGITKLSQPQRVSVRLEQLRALRNATSLYVLTLLGLTSDKGNIELVKKALRPIDELRDEASRRGSGSETEEVEGTPIEGPAPAVNVTPVAPIAVTPANLPIAPAPVAIEEVNHA